MRNILDDPRITTDRTPPKWFLDGIRELDEKLKVVWYNVHEKMGPTYRLVRQVGNRVAHVNWFLTEDEMRILLKDLPKRDAFRRGKEVEEYRSDLFNGMMREARAEKMRKNERREQIKQEFFETAMALPSERLYSVPGVSVRKNWNG